MDIDMRGADRPAAAHSEAGSAPGGNGDLRCPGEGKGGAGKEAEHEEDVEDDGEGEAFEAHQVWGMPRRAANIPKASIAPGSDG